MKKPERLLMTIFLLLCMVFLSAVFAVQGALLTAMIDAYRLDYASQGAANTMAFAGGIAALVCAFALQGRWHKRALLRFSLVVCASGLVLMWLAPSYTLYVAAWFITGFGLGLMDTLLSACMADLYTGRQAVTMMCLLHTCYGLSSVLSPMGYAGLLAAGIPWQQVYLVIGMVGAVLLGSALVVRKALRITDGAAAGQGVQLRQILPTLREGRLLWLVAAIFFHGIFLSGLNTWINRYAEGIHSGIALPAQSCVFLGVMLSRLLMSFLPIKAERYVVVGGFAGGAALCLGLLTGNGWLLRAMLIVSSLMFGALIPCVITLACQRKPQYTLLVTTGIMLSLYLGEAISSPAIAALESLFSLKAGVLLCALSMILFSVCCLFDARSRTR